MACPGFLLSTMAPKPTLPFLTEFLSKRLGRHLTLPPRLAGVHNTPAPQQELFLPPCCTHAPPAQPPALPVPSTIPASRLGPHCSWGQALLASPKHPATGGGCRRGPFPSFAGIISAGPIHHPVQSSFFSLTSSWSLLYRRTYTYIHGPCYFPLPNGLFRSLAQVSQVSSGLPRGLAPGALPGLFDGQGRVLDLEKPQLLGFGGQAGSVSTPHPSLGCWTPCASRGPTTALSPGCCWLRDTHCPSQCRF